MNDKQLTIDNEQLPNGYKKTEVGVIPGDWKVQPVGEAFEIRNNLRLPISKKVRDSMRGLYPYYGPTSVQDYINEYRVEGEHTLIGEDGDHFLKWQDIPMTLLVDGKFNVNNHAHIIRGVDNLTTWFYYFFAHRDLTPYLKRQGAGRFKLNKSTLIEIPCAIPPLPEQRSIAQALSDVDTLIAALEKTIAKKRSIKTATMQQLLTGRKRLPGFGEGKGYQQVEIGVIPEDWKNLQIKNICTLINGRGFKPWEWEREGLPIIRIQNLNGSDEFNYYSGNYNPKIYVQKNQLLFAWSGSKGTSFGPHIWLGPDALLNYHTWKLDIDHSQVDDKYFYHALKVLTRSIEDKAHGASALVHTQKGEMEQFFVPLPHTQEEQRAIATVLSDMDAEIAALEARLTKTQAIKQGMMQELLTGRTRLV